MENQQKHVEFIKRCLELAFMGKGYVEPNPMVGAIVVCDGRIIGEGYHQKYGDNHAEVNAINSVKNKDLLRKSTLYVNLEPCSHHGKTPPCSNFIVEHKIPKVVIGTIDINSEVAGKGIKYMEANGVEVVTGVLEEECREFNNRFFTFHNEKRPYVILKWAQSKDGFIDKKRTEENQKGTWLTNETSRVLVHKWRAEEQAILIGKQTAILDNPSLNIRSWIGKDPLRIVICHDAELPNNLKVLDQSINTIVYCNCEKENKNHLEYKRIDFNSSIVDQVLADLYQRDIQSLIVEGGAETIQYFYKANLWDEIRLFIGERILKNGVKAPEIKGQVLSKKNIGNSELIFLNNSRTY